MPKRMLPGSWAWIVLVVFTALNVALTTVVTTRVAQRSIAADRVARAAAAEQSRAVVCLVVTKQEAVFRDASTQVGRNAADAWHDLGILFRCY
jgi:hypothetical protein